MGDRGNVKIIDSFDPDRHVHLYTHWRGSELKDIVKCALAKRWRWDDSAYLARIVFCEMIKGAEGDETGFGISQEACDEGPLVVLDPANQKITIGKRTWTFEEFVA